MMKAQLVDMSKGKWPDFIFTLAVRLFCGVLLGGLLCVVLSYRGILRSFSHNHMWAAGVWLGLWALIGGLVSVLTTPRWQTPWYQGISGPAEWRNLGAGMTRQEILDQVRRPPDFCTPGVDVWRQRNWELRVSYDQNANAVDIICQTISK